MAKQVRVGSIIFDFRINAAEFEHELKQARTQLRALKKEGQKIARVFKRFALAATGAAGSMAFFARAAAKDVNELVKMSKALRGGVADLQVMERAAELAGSTFINMTTALRRMELVLGQLSAGNAETRMTDSWSRLGLEIQSVMSLPIDKRWETITAAINKYIPAAERASVAAQFFGSRADIELLNLQATTIQRARRELEDFGGGMERFASDDAKRMYEEVNKVGLGLRTLSRELLAQHAPAIRLWASQIAEALKPGGALRALIVGVTDAFRFAAIAMADFVQALRKVFGQTTLAIIAIAGLTSGFVSMTRSMMVVATGMSMMLVRAKMMYVEFMKAQGSVQALSGALTAMNVSAKVTWMSLGIGGVAIAALIAAYNLWKGTQEDAIDLTEQNHRAIEAMSEAYYTLEKAIRGAAGATKEMTAEAKEALIQDIRRVRTMALLQEAEILDSDKLKKLNEEERRLKDTRDNLLDPKALENAMKEAAA